MMFAFYSCKNSNSSDSFTVRTHFSNCAGVKIQLSEMDIHAIIPLDSAQVDQSGEVVFTHKTSQPGFYILKIADRKRIILVTDKGETIDISGGCELRPEEFTIQGSPGSMLLSDFLKTANRNRRSVDSIKNMLHQHEGSPDFMQVTNDADAAFRKIRDEQRQYDLRFLSEHPNSLVCLIVLNYSFGQEPVLDIDNDFIYYQRTDSCLMKAYPDNKHVLFHHQRVTERMRRELMKKNAAGRPSSK
jgi:hypothetical protein